MHWNRFSWLGQTFFRHMQPQITSLRNYWAFQKTAHVRCQQKDSKRNHSLSCPFFEKRGAQNSNFFVILELVVSKTDDSFVGFSSTSRHVFFKSVFLVSNKLHKVAHLNLLNSTFLSFRIFENNSACPMQLENHKSQSAILIFFVQEN